MPKKNIAEEKSFFTIWVPPEARLECLKQHLNNDFKYTVRDALKLLEGANPYWLKDASFANLFNNPDLSNQLLINVFQELDDLNWDFENHNGDFFGEAYQFLVNRFAASMGQAGGEFYTPQSVVELLVELIRPLDGIVYDPCCGTGGMFVQSVKFVKHHSDKDHKKYDIQIFGQEISVYTQRIAKINLSLRGIAANLGKPADTFKDDQHRNLQVNYVLANPQFNQKKFHLDPKDSRYSELGAPPKKFGANFAWVETIISKLKPTGVGAVLMVSNILFNSAEKAIKIRRNLVKNRYLEAVITLPPKLFFEVNIDVYVLILRKGREETDDNVLFIDASDLFVKEDTNLNKLSPKNINEIVSIYQKFQAKKDDYDQERTLIVSPSEIEKDNELYILLPKKFFKDNRNINEISKIKIDELTQQIQTLFKEIEKLNQELTIIYNNLTEICKILINQNKESIRLDLLTTIPNFNIFSPSAYSQILSNIFFTVDLFFAQNINTTIKIKNYFNLISGHTPLKSRVDFYQNGTIKFLTQGGLLDLLP